MNDAATGGHPLHVAGAQAPLVALVVAVAHGARQHVGHRLDPAMGVIGEAGDVVGGIVRAELVQQQKGVEGIKRRGAQRAVQVHPRTVGNAARRDGFRHRPNTHRAIMRR